MIYVCIVVIVIFIVAIILKNYYPRVGSSVWVIEDNYIKKGICTKINRGHYVDGSEAETYYYIQLPKKVIKIKSWYNKHTGFYLFKIDAILELYLRNIEKKYQDKAEQKLAKKIKNIKENK